MHFLNASNQVWHDSLHIHLHHCLRSQDLWSMLHFCIIDLKQVHPGPQKPCFGLTWDRQSRSLATKDWSDISMVSIYHTTDGLNHGCQQQPICEPKPHHCRFQHHLTFWSVQSSISGWYIILNEYQSYENFPSCSWQPWTLMTKLCISICVYPANFIEYSPKMHTAPLSMNHPLMRIGNMRKKFMTIVLMELRDSSVHLMHLSIIPPWWCISYPSHLSCHTYQPSPMRWVSGDNVNVTI